MATLRCLTVIFLLLPLGAWADCEPGAGQTTAEGRTIKILFRTEPAPIKVGELFALHASVCVKSGVLLVRGFKVDASMPDHRHGMNYQPSVLRRGEREFVANGLMFHMPGRWQLVFDVDTANGRERVLYDHLID